MNLELGYKSLCTQYFQNKLTTQFFQNKLNPAVWGTKYLLKNLLHYNLYNWFFYYYYRKD